MKNFQYTFKLFSVLVWGVPFALTGCLSSGEANFGENSEPPYEVGAPGELDDYENNGGTPGEEFTDGGGYNEESPEGGSGSESSEGGGEGPGDEGGAPEGGEEGGSGDEGGPGGEGGDEGAGEEGGEGGDVAGFCVSYEATCGAWPKANPCSDWWTGLEAGVEGDEFGDTKACSWTYLAWAEVAVDADELVSFCEAAAGYGACAPAPNDEPWDDAPFLDCSPSDQAALAALTLEVFEKACVQCHSNESPPKGDVNDIMDLEGLIESQSVLPGNATASKVYQRMDLGEMPPAYSSGPGVTSDDILKVGTWIECLEIQEAEVVIGLEEFYNMLSTDIQNVKASSRKFIRYISMVHLYNAGASVEQLQTYREGIIKLMNSLTWTDKVQTVEYADPKELIVRIDIRDFEWDSFPLAIPGKEGTNVWTQVADIYPYASSLEDNDDLEFVVFETETEVPVVYADWFVANASIPPLYNDLLGLPDTLEELEVMLGVNVENNIALFNNVVRAGLLDSGVSLNNRIVERHAIETISDAPGKLVDYEGAFWLSYDFASNSGKQNIVAHPTDFIEDGGEVVFNLPNGFQGYYICDANGDRLDIAPAEIVKDDNPGFEGETIVNGRSCMKCHFAGMQDATDILYDLANDSSLYPASVSGVIQQLYNPEKFLVEITKDKELFKDSLEEAGVSMVEEPLEEQIFITSERHVVHLTTTDVSSHLYMSWDELKSNPGAERLKNVPELSSFLKNGTTLKRQTFEDTFDDFLCFLDQGDPINPDNGEVGCAIVRICNPLGFDANTTLIVNGVELQAPIEGSCSPCRALPVGDDVQGSLVVTVEDSTLSSTTEIIELGDDDEIVIKLGGTPSNPVLEPVEMEGGLTCEDAQSIL